MGLQDVRQFIYKMVSLFGVFSNIVSCSILLKTNEVTIILIYKKNYKSNIEMEVCKYFMCLAIIVKSSKLHRASRVIITAVGKLHSNMATYWWLPL